MARPTSLRESIRRSSGGAVWLALKVRSTTIRAIYASIVACAVLVFVPITVPVLPVQSFISYVKFLGVSPSESASEKMASGVLPQYYADMFGWKEMAEKVAAVYNALPPEERAKAVFFGGNYGEAAAIDIFGRPLGLPPAISGQNSYYLWGPMGHDASVVILLRNDLTDLRRSMRTSLSPASWTIRMPCPMKPTSPLWWSAAVRFRSTGRASSTTSSALPSGSV